MQPIISYTIILFTLGISLWRPVQVDANLDRLDMDSTDVVQTSYIWQDGDPYITRPDNYLRVEGSNRIIMNSSVQVEQQKGSSHRVPFAYGYWHQDTFQVSIWDHSAYNTEEITLKILDGHFHFTYTNGIGDLRPSAWRTEILRQDLSLNHLPAKGTSCKGQLTVEFLELIQWSFAPNSPTDTIRKAINGTFVIPNI